MSRTYYYFIASLPRIEFDTSTTLPGLTARAGSVHSKIPLSVQDYLKDCKNLLASEDYELVERILTEEGSPIKTDDKILNAWINFNERLRNELAWFRAERAGKDPLNHAREEKSKDPRLTTMIHQISQQPNLLTTEKFLDQMRWEFLDELSFAQYFNMEFLIIYTLKLKILARYEEIYSDKGKKQFAELKTVHFPDDVFV